ncbi:MAG: hypothetical protein JWN45_311 [Acidobacteriaceae bacterium]|nr:hypothetical protein [Acidobacteriaceae bacterium]
MTESEFTGRLRDIAASVLATRDPQLIEARKVSAERRLRLLSKESQPLVFAETHFELACCYLLRYDRRVKGRHIEHAEQHYEFALSVLTSADYASVRGVIQCTLAEGYSRLLSKRDFHDRVRDKMLELFRMGANSFQEGNNLAEAAAAYVRLADLCIDENGSTEASKFLELAVSLTAQDELTDVNKKAVVLDALFEAWHRLVESHDQALVVEQERFSAGAAQELVSTIDPHLSRVPPQLLDELSESVSQFAIPGDDRLYSLRDVLQSHRRRNTLYAFEPPPDPDLFVLDSVGAIPGSQLMFLLNQYRNARTSPLGYAIVPVYYATDRAATGSPSPDEYFSNGRDPTARPSLSYGVASVSIPRDHKMGVIEAPKWWKFERKLSPKKHVTVLSVSPLKRKSFLSLLDSDLDAKADATALVFIHGYNVTFADSIKRTAQICYDLGWKGVPLAYSWPSSGKTKLYWADEASVEATVPFFVDFLEDLIARNKLRLLHIVCHSMGSRALTNALITLKLKRRSLPLINEIVLAAPDIDTQLFTQKVAELRSRCERITLYASSKDLALLASHTLHAFPRAGESGTHMVILPELLDTIDASAVDTSLLGHSYYGDNRSIIGDIYNLLKEHSAPPRFGLQEMDSPKGRYWAFQP